MKKLKPVFVAILFIFFSAHLNCEIYYNSGKPIEIPIEYFKLEEFYPALKQQRLANKNLVNFLANAMLFAINTDSLRAVCAVLDKCDRHLSPEDNIFLVFYRQNLNLISYVMHRRFFYEAVQSKISKQSLHEFSKRKEEVSQIIQFLTTELNLSLRHATQRSDIKAAAIFLKLGAKLSKEISDEEMATYFTLMQNNLML